MPLMLLVAWHAALGLALALASAPELRASPKPVRSLDAARALLAHEALIAAPAAAWMLFRAPDWSFSYAFDASRVPPLVPAVCSLVPVAAALGGLALGAGWIRDQRARAVPAALGALALVCAAALVLARGRLGVVATYAQYRGGFGLRSLRASGMWPSLAWLSVLWIAGGAHLCARAVLRSQPARAAVRSR